jgi:hypothetical protein
MLPIAMIPTGWALLIEPCRKIECLAVAFLTFMAASVVTVWAFGPGLLQVVLDTPGLAQLAAAIGIPPAPISTSRRSILCYPLAIFQPISTVIFSTLFGCLDRHAGRDRASHFSPWRESSQRHVKPIDLVLGYFWITAILHYLLSLSYCVDCIIPYTNYYLPLGALAAAGLTEEFLRLTGERRLAYVALGGTPRCSCDVAGISVFSHVVASPNRNGSHGGDRTCGTAPSKPTGNGPHPCPLRRVEAAQAVWLAGGVVEPRSMYLPSTFRAPKPELSRKERDRIDSIIWDAGLWSEDSMRNALTQGSVARC